MDDLLSEFLAETQESMGELDNEIVHFEQNPEDEETLAKIFRVVHTIKGTCGFLNLPRLENISHAAENLLSQFRNHTLGVTPDLISQILEALDRIKMILSTLEKNGVEPDGDDQDVIQKLAQSASLDSAPAQAELPPEPEKTIPEKTIPEKTIPEKIIPEKTIPEKIIKEPVPEATQSPEEPSEQSISAFQDLANQDLANQDLANQDLANQDLANQDLANPKSTSEIASTPPDSTTPLPAVTQPSASSETVPAPMFKSSESEDAISRAYQAWQMVVERQTASAPPAQRKAKLAAGKANAKKPHHAPQAVQTLRLNIELVESLMNMVSELVLTRNRLMSLVRETAQEEKDGFSTSIQQLNLITSELQEGIMKTRMQPISNAWAKLPRVVRDLSHELDKPLDLKMIGAETELDRQVLEIVKDPLLHMVRNAADHGIEDREERSERGKPETGTITLNAYHEGGHIVIEISDDGKGLDADSIRRKIIEQNLVSETEAKEKTSSELFKYIFHPGFSTATNITAVSGRGVGMDVVKTNIDSINGAVEVRSTVGIGSTFIIKIPLTLAIVSALIVSCGKEHFAIPQINIVEIVQVGKGVEQRIDTIEGMPILRLRDQLLPLITLSDILKIEDQFSVKKQSLIEKLESLDDDSDQNEAEEIASQPTENTENTENDAPETEKDPENAPDAEEMPEDAEAPASEIEEKSKEKNLTNIKKSITQLEISMAVEKEEKNKISNFDVRTHRDGDDPLGHTDLEAIYKDSFIVILRTGNNIYGLIVENVFDMQEIVVKPTSRILSDVSYFSGNTILGDGSVIMILDPNGIANEIGDLSVGSYATDEQDEEDSYDETALSLMLFVTTENIVKAVPLGVIGRLEDIDFSKLEYPGGKPSIQYRNMIMPIVGTPDPFTPPTSGHGTLLVFSDQKKSMGLVVSKIIDIVEKNIDITMTSTMPGYIGSTVINGKAIDIIDAEYYWNQAFIDHLGNSFSNRDVKIESLRILLLDNSRFYRDMIMPYLSALGFSVVTVHSADDAMLHYRQNDKFDVMIANLSGTQEDIYSFVRTIRNRGAWSTMPIFGLAESMSEINIESGYLTGFTDFILKNDRSTLLENLKNLYNTT